MPDKVKNDAVSDEDIGYVLIDSPVGPYSPKSEIIAWIEELKTYPDTSEVRLELERARGYLRSCGDSSVD